MRKNLKVAGLVLLIVLAMVASAALGATTRLQQSTPQKGKVVWTGSVNEPTVVKITVSTSTANPGSLDSKFPTVPVSIDLAGAENLGGKGAGWMIKGERVGEATVLVIEVSGVEAADKSKPVKLIFTWQTRS